MIGRNTLVSLALGAAIVAGCGGDGTAETTTQLQVTGTDALEFEPDAFTVPAGVEVTVELTSGPATEHDFVIEGAAEHGMTGEAGHGAHGEEDHAMESGDLHIAHATAGETAVATFMIDTPGTYEAYCSVPGHRAAGMTATLTVVDDA